MRELGRLQGLSSLSILFLVIWVANGCLVPRSQYSKAVEDGNACSSRLSDCQSAQQGCDQETVECRNRMKELEEGNRALLEDLAEASAGREELARKYERFAKLIREQQVSPPHVSDAYQNLSASLSQEIQEGKIRIEQTESRLKLNLVDRILFASGSTALTKQGREVLRKIGIAIKDNKDRRVIIEGHTDDQPLGPNLKKRISSNWDLSALRASAVVHFLQQEVGIDPTLLSAAGYSMYQPLVPNDSPENRQINRRIEIVLVPKTSREGPVLGSRSPTKGSPSP